MNAADQNLMNWLNREINRGKKTIEVPVDLLEDTTINHLHRQQANGYDLKLPCNSVSLKDFGERALLMDVEAIKDLVRDNSGLLIELLNLDKGLLVTAIV